MYNVYEQEVNLPLHLFCLLTFHSILSVQPHVHFNPHMLTNHVHYFQLHIIFGGNMPPT